MRNVIVLAILLIGARVANAQETATADFLWIPDLEIGLPTFLTGTEPDSAAYYVGGPQNGARSVSGPFDIDNDGNMEILATDYTGGGRIHILESVGVDMWEHVWSSPWVDPTTHSGNARFATVGDLDGDGLGELWAFMGRGYSDQHPLISILQPGLYGFEINPATGGFAPFPDVWYWDGDTPDRTVNEQIIIADVDGDGAQEIMFGNNAGSGWNDYDNWYVLSATGLGEGFAAFLNEARWSTRVTDSDPVNRGGGSAYGIIPANLDGGMDMELALNSWNNHNFTNIKVTGPNTYVGPSVSDTAAFRHALSNDRVALFGCVAVDIDSNGDDEVYCPTYSSGELLLLNYEDGENVLEVNDFNLAQVASGGFVHAITAGDIDGDGRPELIGTPTTYKLGQFLAEEAPPWLTVADYNEGDIEDPKNYSVRSIHYPEDMLPIFDTVNRDSAGVMTTFLRAPNSGLFGSGVAFLGDVDDDGNAEVAVSFQAVVDSLYTYKQVFNPADSTYAETVESSMLNPNRAFVRIFSGNGITTQIEEDRVIIPSDYVLHPNYPNPFNPSTTFSFTLPLDKRVSVRVYDVTGRLVRTLINGELYSEGTHNVTWDGLSNSGSPVASGNYFYTLEWGQFRHARQMILVK